MNRGDIIDIKIDSIAFGGAGVGRHTEDDRNFVIFVDDAVPGDEVTVKIGGKKRSHAFGHIQKFVKKSDKRITARCKHFGPGGDRCGGCSLQYLSYADQLSIKEQNVKDAMSRIGGISDDVVLPIKGCENEWFYRNKMEFSFSRDPEGKLSLGLHVKRRHHDLTELGECFLFADYIGDFVSKMREFFRQADEGGLIFEGMKLMSLIIREGKRTGEIMVNLVVENGEPAFLNNFLLTVQEVLKSQNLKSIYFTKISNKKGKPKKIEESLLWGAKIITERMDISDDVSLSFEISPQSFFQPNTLQAEKLYKLAIDFADVSGNEIVFDLYCGAGTISLAFSKLVKTVYGIELNKDAIKNANTNAKLNKIENAQFFEGDVNKIMSELTEKPDVIVVDPPRNGLHEEVIEQIEKLNPKKIVYVSCNPTTLARDLNLFTKTGYNLIKVQPVDMFPQTYHIESVAYLTK